MSLPPDDNGSGRLFSDVQIQLSRLVDLACNSEITTQYVIQNLENLTIFLKQFDKKIAKHIQPTMLVQQEPYLYTCDSESYNQEVSIPSKKSSIEKERAVKRLGSFDPKSSNAWKELSSLFGLEVKQTFLIEVAKKLSSQLNLPLDREAKRRKSVLIKWFEENWDHVSSHLSQFIPNHPQTQ